MLFALFLLLRPRRYVELGVHNGMSFFAACQIAERLELTTECVAIDSWIGDVHAGFHTNDVFDRFREYLGSNYPDQCFIHAYFNSALRCFDNGSIDLLHIDGLHTYAAVKEDFETWLPKLSDAGVIIFHDINEYGRGFGVWQFWEELSEQYPSYSFAHQHGLGIIFVGQKPHAFAALLRSMSENRDHAVSAQAYFQAVGTLLVEQRSTAAALEAEKNRQDQAHVARIALEEPTIELRGQNDRLHLQLDALQNEHDNLQNEHRNLQNKHDNLQIRFLELEVSRRELELQFAQLQERYDEIGYSTTWRATAPVRALLTRMPPVRGLLRRGTKFTWWTVTGQLPSRYRSRKTASNERAGRLRD